MRDGPGDSVRASLLTFPGPIDRSERRFLGGGWLRDLVSKARNFVETLLMPLSGNRVVEQNAIWTFFSAPVSWTGQKKPVRCVRAYITELALLVSTTIFALLWITKC